MLGLVRVCFVYLDLARVSNFSPKQSVFGWLRAQISDPWWIQIYVYVYIYNIYISWFLYIFIMCTCSIKVMWNIVALGNLRKLGDN